MGQLALKVKSTQGVNATISPVSASDTNAGYFVQIKNVSKKYGSSYALQDININIKKGEFVSIIGPSGAGKSTLVRLLIREELPTTGEIIIANRSISRLKPFQLPFFRRKIGVVFQDFRLLPHKTVGENVSFALEVAQATNMEIKNRLPKILNLVGLSEKEKSYPPELSGGEKQRVSLARALVHSPKILIADEPTGNLDPENAKEVIDLLLKINSAGALVILATHNKDVVNSLRRRVISMDAGKIISDKRQGIYQ